MRSLLATSLAIGALLAAPAAGALLADDPRHFLVGHEPGASAEVEVLLESAGATVAGGVSSLDILFVEADAGLPQTLLGAPGVSFVEEDAPVRMAGTQWNGAQWDGAQWNHVDVEPTGPGEDPGTEDQWGIEAVRAQDAWAMEAGAERARLCVADTGVDKDHPDVGARVVANKGDDDVGHGTHVAGVAAAIRDNGHGGAGVTASAVLSVKILDSEGRGTNRQLVEGLSWCVERDADVVLLALSTDGPSRAIERAIDHLERHEVVAVTSAGNDGCSGCVNPLARDARVLSVAAVAPDGSPAPFSASGPEVDLAAPGVKILSTYAGSAYARGSGTSQAAAWVAGAAALLREADPTLDAADVRAALVGSARDLGEPGRDDATGAGVLDVAAAVGSAGG